MPTIEEGEPIKGLSGHEPIRRALDKASEKFSPHVLKRVSARGKFMLGMDCGIKIRRARKDYDCECCSEPIKKGDNYAFYGSGRHPSGWRMRLECL